MNSDNLSSILLYKKRNRQWGKKVKVNINAELSIPDKVPKNKEHLLVLKVRVRTSKNPRKAGTNDEANQDRSSLPQQYNEKPFPSNECSMVKSRCPARCLIPPLSAAATRPSKFSLGCLQGPSQVRDLIRRCKVQHANCIIS